MKKIIIILFAMGFVSCKHETSKEESYYKDADITAPGVSARNPQEPFEVGGPWPPPSDDLASDVLADNYLIVLDDSGSMRGDKMNEAKIALKKCIEFIPSEANVGYMVFNDDGLLLPFGSTDQNRKRFKGLVDQTSATGSTPLRQTLKNAYRYLSTQASVQKGYGSYHLIIVTDGESGDGNPVGLTRLMVGTSLIQVHVVGFHVDSHSMNIPGFVNYHTAKSASDLEKAFKAVTAETEEFISPADFESL